ncbi:hypothetical protein LXA54_17020 [Erwinia amylovora]|uniref:hypothetical protein n=1 Tax=Erwinia amylovora TaxID=552 RepID=UPI0020BDE340|nr:hypothetical protein [Erwinia amylovora]MCK8335992.1 hypothetical protein [Erwinia amylovora]
METEYYTVITKDWIKEQKMEYRDRAFDYPNTEYFKVLNEIAEHKEEFVANTGELVNFAVEFSPTYNALSPEDKAHVTDLLQQEIFFIDFMD